MRSMAAACFGVLVGIILAASATSSSCTLQIDPGPIDPLSFDASSSWALFWPASPEESGFQYFTPGAEGSGNPAGEFGQLSLPRADRQGGPFSEDLHQAVLFLPSPCDVALRQRAHQFLQAVSGGDTSCHLVLTSVPWHGVTTLGALRDRLARAASTATSRALESFCRSLSQILTLYCEQGFLIPKTEEPGVFFLIFDPNELAEESEVAEMREDQVLAYLRSVSPGSSSRLCSTIVTLLDPSDSEPQSRREASRLIERLLRETNEGLCLVARRTEKSREDFREIDRVRALASELISESQEAALELLTEPSDK